MYDVFLSYRRDTGTEVCSELCEVFKEKKEELNVFFDRNSLRVGAFEEQIDKAIRECTFLLLILASENDLTRCLRDPEHDWILHEVGLARKYKKNVVPVKVKDTFKFPDLNYKYWETLDFIRGQQVCDVSGPDFYKNIREKLFVFLGDMPSAAQRDEYLKGITAPDYLEWETRSLRKIYADCDMVTLKKHDCDKKTDWEKTYPVVIRFGSPKAAYPFPELNDLKNLQERPDSPLDFASLPLHEDFKKIVSPNIHYPDLYGFTNVGMLFDENGRVTGFRACPRTYRETVYTGHILQYELWRAYQKLGKEREAELEDLPIRQMIHEGRTNEEVLWSGCSRSSLCDVCMAVLAYDKVIHSYAIAAATRTDSVACQPGYFSIIPAGGFELYEREDNQSDTNIRSNFKMISALYREYIEEIFGDKNFEKPTGNDDLRRLLRNEHIIDLTAEIGRTYFLEFLGVTLDLTSLRPTFSFVLRIDDPDFLYNNNIGPNEENTKFSFFNLKEFDEKIIEREKEKAPLMPESAGLYVMLKENHLYKEALVKSMTE